MVRLLVLFGALILLVSTSAIAQTLPPQSQAATAEQNEIAFLRQQNGNYEHVIFQQQAKIDELTAALAAAKSVAQQKTGSVHQPPGGLTNDRGKAIGLDEPPHSVAPPRSH